MCEDVNDDRLFKNLKIKKKKDIYFGINILFEGGGIILMRKRRIREFLCRNKIEYFFIMGKYFKLFLSYWICFC